MEKEVVMIILEGKDAELYREVMKITPEVLRSKVINEFFLNGMYRIINKFIDEYICKNKGISL